MCLHNLVAVWGHMAPGLLVYSVPTQGIESLGLRHGVKFLRTNIPGSFSGLGPWADAKKWTRFHSGLFHGWRAFAPGTRTSAPSFAGASVTHRPAVARSWWAWGWWEKRLADANFLVLGPVYLPESWKPRWEPHPHHWGTSAVHWCWVRGCCCPGIPSRSDALGRSHGGQVEGAGSLWRSCWWWDACLAEKRQAGMS